MKSEKKAGLDLVYLQIKNPKDDETPFLACEQVFSSLLTGKSYGILKSLFKTYPSFSFEIFLLSQRIYFYVTVPKSKEILIKSLLQSAYPNLALVNTTDPMNYILSAPYKKSAEFKLSQPSYLPLKTYEDFKNVDPLTSIIGFLSRHAFDLRIAIQILISPPDFDWKNYALEKARGKITDDKTGNLIANPEKPFILRKISTQGGRVSIRVAIASSQNLDLNSYIQDIYSAFGSFALGEGNSFVIESKNSSSFLKKLKQRKFGLLENRRQILSAKELATLWHPPGKLLSGVKNIVWGKALSGEPPDNLPIAYPGIPLEEKQKINFFAKTEFKNRETIFGIKDQDRLKHIYIIGKTGAGKSTLIANMAIDDIRKGRGVGIIDPHGDLAEILLDYIPKRRINDVVYLEPFDLENPFALNILEVKNKHHKELVASGIVSIFYKLYKESWGPRLEYILRNVILTLVDVGNTTLVDVLRILSHKNYRKKVIEKLKDPVLKDFWEKEFEKMPDKLRQEAISPIQNKVGQFVSSRFIRNVVGRQKSTIDLEEIMNSGKVLILNLSQGKLGEDNAALLGAMIITQIQIATMNRAYMREEERRPFYLYVDEFQNFATTSFIKILSEARKYKLALTLANQYIDQLSVDIQKAIFGNVGTLISFVVGSYDAEVLEKEFRGVYTKEDLVSLGKYEILLKLSIDGQISSPFHAKTLPLPSLKNENREKIIKQSKLRYSYKK